VAGLRRVPGTHGVGGPPRGAAGSELTSAVSGSGPTGGAGYQAEDAGRKPGLGTGLQRAAERSRCAPGIAGFEVVYKGMRLTPSQIVAGGVQEGVQVVGLSSASGSHLEWFRGGGRVRAAGADESGDRRGNHSKEDEPVLRERGSVAARVHAEDYALTDKSWTRLSL